MVRFLGSSLEQPYGGNNGCAQDYPYAHPLIPCYGNTILHFGSSGLSSFVSAMISFWLKGRFDRGS